MIKLTNILKELEKPSQVYTTNNPPEEDFIQKGFKLSKPEINPETGSTT